MGKPFFTWEDAKIAFNLFCCVYGIGTLGMPGNFARSGPVIASCALFLMAVANIYASVVISKVLLIAPPSVRTYSDLGEWCLGRTGRYLIIVSQMGVCLFVPIAFLILGGTLLENLFPGAFSQTTWIIFMAASTLPFCLTATLKEGAMAAFAGCIGTIAADVIGVSVLMHGMRGHPTIPSPRFDFEQVATVFGNLALAYGAGIVIPALQRQHSDPTRMPRVIFITLTFISILFLILSGTAYSAVGCQIPGNLLFAIANSASTGLTKLGFASDRGMIVLAYFAMQVHMIIGFNVILAPAFYLLERLLLGMHERPPVDLEAPKYVEAATPNDENKSARPSAQRPSVVSMADIERDDDIDNGERERLEYVGKTVQYMSLRTVLIIIMVLVAITFRDKFGDVVDFVGASCHSTSSIILPMVFGLRKLGNKMPLWEKALSIIGIVFCIFLGVYVTFTSGRNLFAPTAATAAWPFCKAADRDVLYYNATLVHAGVTHLL